MGKYDSYLNAQGVRISKATGKPVKAYNKKNKVYWAMRERGEQPDRIKYQEINPVIAELQSLYTEEEIKGIISLKKDASPIELVEITPKSHSDREGSTGFLIASDWHADEVVKASTVLGKNEYNKDIAEARVKTFFANAVYMIRKKPVDNLVVAFIGDLIGGFIHPELEQTNSMSPMAGISFVKSLIISGLKYLNDSLP